MRKLLCRLGIHKWFAYEWFQNGEGGDYGGVGGLNKVICIHCDKEMDV